jgi:hypothetical protein
VRDIDVARAYLETRDDVRFDGETCTIEGWVRPRRSTIRTETS